MRPKKEHVPMKINHRSHSFRGSLRRLAGLWGGLGLTILAATAFAQMADMNGTSTSKSDKTTAGQATPAKASAAAQGVKSAKALGDPYPLDVCPVSGDKLGKTQPPVILHYKGREIRLCCSNCVAPFKATPEAFLKKIDAAIVEKEKASYPLATCPVSGKPLGKTPVMLVYNNRLVEFCCPDCPPVFMKDPATYLKKMDAAIVKAQKPTYAMTTCPVSGLPLDAKGTPTDVVFANRLVRFCCSDCAAAFKKDPLKYMAKLDAAEASKTKPATSAKSEG
jgi:YHS domain-containing protein